MMIVLLLSFILLFGLVFAFLTLWDQLRARMIVSGVIIIVLLFGALGVLRYQFSNSTGCAPNCAGVNLVGRNFQGLRLNESIFIEADLSRANLSRAQLASADFGGATLRAVNLEGANLADANFSGADLTGANLAGANLVGANLSGANLSNAVLTGVDLTKTTLRGVQFIEAELIGVNLTGAQLNAVNLSRAKMNGARLVNANLSGAILSGADLSGALFTNSRLNGAWLNLSTLIGANLISADLSGSSMIGADLASADLGDSSLVGSILIGANLRGANLQGVDLRGVRLDVANLTTEDIRLDPVLAELNELQRSQVFFDAQLDGVSFDAQTVWSDSPVTARFVGAQSVPVEDVDALKVGLLLALSGPLAVTEMGIRDGMLLAIDEINTAGGVLGQTLDPILEDGSGDVNQFTQRLTRLLESEAVSVIFGGSISEKRRAALPLLAETDTLLFYPFAYEGFEESDYVVYAGPDPSQVVIPAVDYLLSQGHREFVLVGSETLYSRSVNRIIQAQLEDAGLTPAGVIYFPITSTDFGQFIAQLESVTPSAIINTILGQGNADFFAQLHAAGFRPENLPVLNLTVAEAEIRFIGPELMAGHLVAGSYFQTSQTSDNFAFVTAFKSAYGDTRVTSDAIASGYSAVYLWKSLVEAAQSAETDVLRALIKAGDFEIVNPKGTILLDGATRHLSARSRVGVIRQDGLIDDLSSSSAPLTPDPFLTQFDWASALGQAIDELRQQREEGND